MRFVVAIILLFMSIVTSQSCSESLTRADAQILLTPGTIRNLEDLRTCFFA